MSQNTNQPTPQGQPQESGEPQTRPQQPNTASEQPEDLQDEETEGNTRTTGL